MRSSSPAGAPGFFRAAIPASYRIDETFAPASSGDAGAPTLYPRPVSKAPSERTILFLLGAVQLVNVLDFMMVMPLGPDFSAALGIPTDKLGLIGGSYTASASVAGLAGAFFLDRFDRRKALAVSMAGLVLGTAAGGLATGLGTLVLARIVAGAFGGPATALALSVIADVIPPERRGKALGAVMGAFAVASVFGVPAGLELARLGGWRLPFFAVAGLGVVIAAGGIFFLPPLRGHLAGGPPPRPDFLGLVRKDGVALSSAMTGLLMMGGFALIPNIASYIQFNLGYPRERLGILYMAGGAVSFAATRIAGFLVDRFGAPKIGLLGTVMFSIVVLGGFYVASPPVPLIFVFMGFMLSMSMRNIPYNTLLSKVPGPRDRASFMSLQSTLQHAGAALGAVLSSQILVENPDKSLAHMPEVALVAIGLSATLPVFLLVLEGRLRARAAAPAPAAA